MCDLCQVTLLFTTSCAPFNPSPAGSSGLEAGRSEGQKGCVLGSATPLRPYHWTSSYLTCCPDSLPLPSPFLVLLPHLRASPEPASPIQEDLLLTPVQEYKGPEGSMILLKRRVVQGGVSGSDVGAQVKGNRGI